MMFGAMPWAYTLFSFSSFLLSNIIGNPYRCNSHADNLRKYLLPGIKIEIKCKVAKVDVVVDIWFSVSNYRLAPIRITFHSIRLIIVRYCIHANNHTSIHTYTSHRLSLVKVIESTDIR